MKDNELQSSFTRLRNAMDANTQAKGYNTTAIENSTESLGRWEAKDEYYHKEHHKILTKILKTQREILGLLKNV